MNRRGLGLALALLAFGPAAGAQTVCTLLGGASLAFAPYDTLAAGPSDSLASVQVRCSRSGGPQNVTVSLAVGGGTNGTVSNRRMARTTVPADFLDYGLFRDSGRSANWGTTDGVDTGTVRLSISNNSSATATFTIYARLRALQNVYAGSYSDTVTLTLSP